MRAVADMAVQPTGDVGRKSVEHMAVNMRRQRAELHLAASSDLITAAALTTVDLTTVDLTVSLDLTTTAALTAASLTTVDLTAVMIDPSGYIRVVSDEIAAKSGRYEIEIHDYTLGSATTFVEY